jgi:hypothetical protein
VVASELPSLELVFFSSRGILTPAATARPRVRAAVQRSQLRCFLAPGHSSFREEEELYFFIWPKTSGAGWGDAMGRPPPGMKIPLKPFERLPMIEELPYDRLLLSNEFSGCGRLP